MYIYNGIALRMAPWLLVCCQIINPQNDTPCFQMPLPTRSCSQLQFWWKGKFTKTIPHPYLHYFPASSIFMCQILYDSTFHALLWYSSWQSTLVKKTLPLFVLERYLLLGLSRESMFPAISTDLQLFEASSSLCSWFCWLCTTFLWWPVVTWYGIMVVVKAVGSGNSKCWHVPWKKKATCYKWNTVIMFIEYLFLSHFQVVYQLFLLIRKASFVVLYLPYLP